MNKNRWFRRALALALTLMMAALGLTGYAEAPQPDGVVLDRKSVV